MSFDGDQHLRWIKQSIKGDRPTAPPRLLASCSNQMCLGSVNEGFRKERFAIEGQSVPFTVDERYH